MDKQQEDIFVECMEKGYSVTRACEDAKISTQTYYKRKASDKDEDKAFIARCSVQYESRTNIVEDALFVNATKKQNVIAQLFWLKNRRQRQWRDKIDNVEDSQEVKKIEVTIRRKEPRKKRKGKDE